MFSKGAIRAEMRGRRTALFGATMVAVLSVPAMMYGFDPPAYTPDLTQAKVHGCANCHGTFSGTSGISVAGVPANYTAGSTSVNMTVSLPGGQGFYLAILDSASANAGTITAGTGSQVTAVGGVNFLTDSTSGTSWTFSWTPPTTAAGTVGVYVAGGTHGASYATSYMIPAASTAPPATLVAAPTSLTFTVNGANPATQTVMVTSSGASISGITTSASVTTPAGGKWLTFMPPGGSTPLTSTVGISAAGLAAGTYMGSVSYTAAGASNSPLSVPVTLNVMTPIPAAVPTLMLSTSSLNFTAMVGGTVSSQSVMVTASDGTAVTYTDSATTATGGSWLSVDGGADTTGSTPEPISVTLPSGLGAGTYTGSVTFTSSAVSNSPVTLPVTLTVTSTPPPTTGGESFSLAVVDRQSGGIDLMLLDGSGSGSSSGNLTGSGYFTRFRSPRSGSSTTTIVSSGTWTKTSVTSCTPISGSTTGGTLVMQVQITTHGVSTPSTGTMTITSTGSSAGVKLAITGGSTFNSVGIGTESITCSGTGGGGGGDDGGTTTPPPTPPPPPDN